MVFRATTWYESFRLIRRHDNFYLIAALLGASIILMGTGVAYRLEALQSAQQVPGVTAAPQNIASARGPGEIYRARQAALPAQPKTDRCS
jgi:hypothetical protein